MIQLKSIINLRSENDIDSKMNPFLQSENHITIEVKDHNPPTIEQAFKFIELVKTLPKPMLIHCQHGHGRTSTFSVLTKIALGMGFDESFKDEEKRFHYNFKHKIQIEFLQNFKSIFHEKNNKISSID